MRKSILAAVVVGTLLAPACVSPKGKTADEKHSSAVEIRDEALAQLYERRPEAKEVIESSPGYAFFSGGSFHPGLCTFAFGWGMIQDNETGEQAFDKYWRFGLGPGLAIKGNYGVIVAKSKEALEKYNEGGWLSSGGAEASFKFGNFGGSAAGATHPSGAEAIYAWTHTGFALELLWVWGHHSPKDEL